MLWMVGLNVWRFVGLGAVKDDKVVISVLVGEALTQI